MEVKGLLMCLSAAVIMLFVVKDFFSAGRIRQIYFIMIIHILYGNSI